jgi:hypothetical protein
MYLHFAVFTNSRVEADNITNSTMNPMDSYKKKFGRKKVPVNVRRRKEKDKRDHGPT